MSAAKYGGHKQNRCNNQHILAAGNKRQPVQAISSQFIFTGDPDFIALQGNFVEKPIERGPYAGRGFANSQMQPKKALDCL